MPISNDRMVPETAPTANSTPIARAQVRARRAMSRSPAWPRHSANSTIAGKATPKQATMMCHPSDSAICERAYTKSAGASSATNRSWSPTMGTSVRDGGGAARPDVTEREGPLIVQVGGTSFGAWAASDTGSW
jgi:hypothetical protein